MIAALDEKYMYFIGQDLSAMDMGSRDLKWSAKLPQVCGNRPLVSGGHLFVSLGRGIYEIDTASGDTVRIFRGADRDSEGGNLYQGKEELISVSNRSVTAYPVKGVSAARAN
jgi:outer membrane protein assembly factor BamB